MPYTLGEHAVEMMIERGYNPQDLQDTLQNVARVIRQSNGNKVFVGQNGVGVVVDQASGAIIFVLRPGMVPR